MEPSAVTVVIFRMRHCIDRIRNAQQIAASGSTQVFVRTDSGRFCASRTPLAAKAQVDFRYLGSVTENQARTVNDHFTAHISGIPHPAYRRMKSEP